MTHLVYLITPGAPAHYVVERYNQALRPAGDVELHLIAIPGLSSAFVQEADSLRRNGRVVPGLLSKRPPKRGHQTLSMVAFSAGCWLVREALRHPEDRASIDACVMLDGVHDTIDEPKDVALDHELGPYLAYAERAKAGEALFWIGHSDVETAPSYASTTTAARRLVKACEPGGNFYVRPFNDFPSSQAKQEHAAALVGWGPNFVAEALVPYLTKLRSPALPGAMPAWRDPKLTVWERAVEWSLEQPRLGKLETEGENAGPEIAKYHKPAMRVINGVERPVGITRGPWCASSACYAERAVLLPNETALLPYRCSGIEMARDAAAKNLWRPIDVVRSGAWLPQRGDICILTRGNPGSWERHVTRVVDVNDDAGSLSTIGGNEGDGRWRVSGHAFVDDDVIGFIEGPRRVPVKLDDWFLRQIVETSDDVVNGRFGLEHAMRGLLHGAG